MVRIANIMRSTKARFASRALRYRYFHFIQRKWRIGCSLGGFEDWWNSITL